jgi:hypothetical protein
MRNCCFKKEGILSTAHKIYFAITHPSIGTNPFIEVQRVQSFERLVNVTESIISSGTSMGPNESPVNKRPKAFSTGIKLPEREANYPYLKSRSENM